MIRRVAGIANYYDRRLSEQAGITVRISFQQGLQTVIYLVFFEQRFLFWKVVF